MEDGDVHPWALHEAGAVGFFAALLGDEGARVGEIAAVDEIAHGLSDGEGDVCIFLGGEGERLSLGVVMLGCDAHGGAAANGEVRTEDEERAECWRGFVYE